MARVAFLDDGFAFDGAALRERPLGGVQSSTIMLAEALAARGHEVTVANPRSTSALESGVTYRPLAAMNDAFDLVIANAAPKLLRFARAPRRVLWLRGPARYLTKARHLAPLAIYRPKIVFIGAYHRSTWPGWLPLDGQTIPYGIAPMFLEGAPAPAPPPPRLASVK